MQGQKIPNLVVKPGLCSVAAITSSDQNPFMIWFVWRFECSRYYVFCCWRGRAAAVGAYIWQRVEIIDGAQSSPRNVLGEDGLGDLFDRAVASARRVRPGPSLEVSERPVRTVVSKANFYFFTAGVAQIPSKLCRPTVLA